MVQSLTMGGPPPMPPPMLASQRIDWFKIPTVGSKIYVLVPGPTRDVCRRLCWASRFERGWCAGMNLPQRGRSFH